MKIKNIKDVKKWVRESTLKELKDNLIITLERIKTKQELALFLKDYVGILEFRLKEH